MVLVSGYFVFCALRKSKQSNIHQFQVKYDIGFFHPEYKYNNPLTFFKFHFCFSAEIFRYDSLRRTKMVFINFPLAHKRQFHWISKSRLMRAVIGKLQNFKTEQSPSLYG